jgi:hypothetical protein
VLIVALILLTAILANVIANVRYPELLGKWPLIGMGAWGAILVAAPLRAPDWQVLPETFKGTIFLLALVTSASMMPVETLPLASWQTALGLGFVSAVFDNIPLTALALKQGGYDWGYLAYAVGFGGSMIWFGSSAGVALANMYPDAKSSGRWLLDGWHVIVAYVAGFFVMLALLGWHPDPPHRKGTQLPNPAVGALHEGSGPVPDPCPSKLAANSFTRGAGPSLPPPPAGRDWQRAAQPRPHELRS